jgi:hypothetical protein
LGGRRQSGILVGMTGRWPRDQEYRSGDSHTEQHANHCGGEDHVQDAVK